MKCLIAIIVSVLGFGPVDSLFHAGALQPCKEGLETLLTQADSDKEKAQVLWRLSRVTLLEGEAVQGKEARRSVFDKGADYAQKGMKLDPSNEKCYLWHCANLGRSLQTRPMMEQASAVPLLLSDLTTILDKLGKTSYSEAWQALAEIYYNHPFKSNDAAINFTRRAVACIPKGELRLSTYLSLAKMLHKRDWSASKRLSAIESNQDKFEKGKASNIERYSCYDGHYGPGGTAPWSSRALSQLSDREEAAAIVSYALRRYQRASAHTPVDKEDYRQLQAFAKTL